MLNNYRQKIITIIKRFAISDTNFCEIKYNIIFGIFAFLLIFSADIVLVIKGISDVSIEIIVSLITCCACFVISFCGVFLKIAVISIIFVPLAMNINYLTFSGSPVGL